jgi:hypothetical protein
MRFMILVKADKNTEAGVLPSEKLLTEMGKYNEELVKAGVLLAAEGLQPSSKGARVRFSGAKRTVIDGPFTEAKESIAGLALYCHGTRKTHDHLVAGVSPHDVYFHPCVHFRVEDRLLLGREDGAVLPELACDQSDDTLISIDGPGIRLQ